MKKIIKLSILFILVLPSCTTSNPSTNTDERLVEYRDGNGNLQTIMMGAILYQQLFAGRSNNYINSYMQQNHNRLITSKSIRRPSRIEVQQYKNQSNQITTKKVIPKSKRVITKKSTSTSSLRKSSSFSNRSRSSSRSYSRSRR